MYDGTASASLSPNTWSSPLISDENGQLQPLTKFIGGPILQFGLGLLRLLDHNLCFVGHDSPYVSDLSLTG